MGVCGCGGADATSNGFVPPSLLPRPLLPVLNDAMGGVAAGNTHSDRGDELDRKSNVASNAAISYNICN
jgi:hypothetical protein